MVILVNSATSLVARGTGVGTVPSLAPVSMLRIVTLLTESAHARRLMVVSVLLAGLVLTVVCPAAMILGGQTVRMLACVSTMVRVIRYNKQSIFLVLSF